MILRFLIVTALLLSMGRQVPIEAARGPRVGELLQRIRCSQAFEARVFALGLDAPDGLTLDTRGRVHVVEENAGCVTRIAAGGEHVILASGLRSPEGLCGDGKGGFLVVEDGAQGRLLALDAEGDLEVLAEHLDAPEGVTLLGDNIYVTESNVQLVGNKLAATTHVFALARDVSGRGTPGRILNRGFPLSFSEVVADGPGHLLLANEIAGPLVPAGILRFEIATGELEVFATDVISPEGLAWTPGPERFPLYIAEEDVDGAGHGRLSCIDAEGRRTTFATGFGRLEAVVVASDGTVYVSEDSTGMVIALRPTE